MSQEKPNINQVNVEFPKWLDPVDRENLEDLAEDIDVPVGNILEQDKSTLELLLKIFDGYPLTGATVTQLPVTNEQFAIHNGFAYLLESKELSDPSSRGKMISLSPLIIGGRAILFRPWDEDGGVLYKLQMIPGGIRSLHLSFERCGWVLEDDIDSCLARIVHVLHSTTDKIRYELTERPAEEITQDKQGFKY